MNRNVGKLNEREIPPMTGENAETKSVELMRRCSRYLRCFVPVCPLDLLQDVRTRLKEEPLCTLPKSIRHRIGKGTALPRQGLTRKEWAAHRRWQSLSEAERNDRIAKLRPFRRIIHGAGVSGREGEYYHALDQNTCTNTGKTPAGDISS